jgi:signal transduction histidine kinase
MTRRRPARLATRLMTAQVLVIAVGALAIIAATAVVAPSLFRYHLAQTGETDPMVQRHAEEAFAASFAIALLLATVLSLVAAGLASWFIVRRVAHPVEELADAAETLAAGGFEVDVPVTAFSSEIARLTNAFERMATKLADTETTRRQMLSDLAHELRTPLATLEAHVDGLEDLVLPHDEATYATMRDQIIRLRRLSGDLREAALAQEHALGLQLQPEDARTIVQSAVAAAAPRYERAGIALSCRTPADDVPVQGDAIRLQQVLANLFDNALRHARTHVHVALSANDDEAIIAVTDDGDGIPTEDLESIFHRFHRVDPARRSFDGSGSGLGLTIARAIVEDHNGTLTAASGGAGSGATFTIRLSRHHKTPLSRLKTSAASYRHLSSPVAAVPLVQPVPHRWRSLG